MSYDDAYDDDKFSGMTPDGLYTDSEDEYVTSWREFYSTICRAFDASTGHEWHAWAFDPGVSISTFKRMSRRAIELDHDTAKVIYELQRKVEFLEETKR